MVVSKTNFCRRRPNSILNLTIRSSIPEEISVVAFPPERCVKILLALLIGLLLTCEPATRILLNEKTAFDGLLQDLVESVLEQSILLQFIGRQYC